MNKFIKPILLVVFLFSQIASYSQCAMCKATAESNPNVGGGLNTGIEYILLFPYILLGAFVIFVLKGKAKSFWRDLTGRKNEEKKDLTAENWY